MKRLLLSIMLMAGVMTAQADGYSYLTFETTDGTKVSVDVSSLTLTISGNTLTAGSQSFTISNLVKMYFSTTDESTATDIQKMSSAVFSEAIDIYDLQGKKVTKEQMQKGIYIVKTKQGTHKIAVK